MQPGDVVQDRWVVEALAGTGGMGAVYRARDRGTGELVAIKVLGRSLDATAVRRFEREATILSALAHPNIVRYIAQGRGPEGHWLAMEWLEGEALDVRLRRGRLDAAEAIDLVRGVAEGLCVAHARGIIHRDLKPANIWLGATHPKILDFGIARPMQSDETQATRTGVLLGTPAYMAPEQARGGRALDARVDVFALGCVLFEALAGRPAFVGEHVLAVLAKILFEDPPAIRELCADVPPAIDVVVSAMIAKDAEARPRDAAAVLELLSRLHAPSLVPPASGLGLGRAEQRVVSVVVLAPPNSEGTAPTVVATRDTLDSRDTSSPVAELAREFHGTYARLLDGTSVLAITGEGTASDRAIQAARCARALRARAPDAVIALATGSGVVAERSTVGEVIDRAVRLLRAGPVAGGRVRIDEITAELVAERFDVTGEGLGEEREAAVEARTLLGRVTRCIGRERELGTLLALFDECRTESVARAALLTGPAGAGKSRIARELLERLPGQDVELIIARGDPMHARSPLGLLADALRRAARVRDRRAGAGAIRAWVSRFVADADGVAELVAELARVDVPNPSVSLRAARADVQVMHDQTRRAMQELLFGIVRVRPLLVLVEDLQHGDLPSVRALDTMLRVFRDEPVFVLALGRPEVHELFPRLWEERDVQEIRLAPLSRRAAESMVRDALGDVAPDRVTRLVERAGGNPFVLEELIRAAAAGREDILPASAIAMVQSRLDELDEEARRELRAASVFGESAWSSGLEVLLGTPATSIGTLITRELLERRAVSRFAGQPELGFRHAIVREAAYETLTPEDRKLGHALAAGWLEEAGETDALALAEHWVRAEQPERAARHWLQAAREAVRALDHPGALALATRALVHATDDELAAELLTVMAGVHVWSDSEACESRTTEAMARAKKGGEVWCAAAAYAAQSAGLRGDIDRVEAIAREALELEGGREWSLLMCKSATRLIHGGRRAFAAELLSRVAPGDDVVVEAWYLHARACEGMLGGDPVAWRDRERQALACLERAGDRRNVVSARINVAHAMIELGQLDEAEGPLREAIGEAEAAGLTVGVLWAKHHRSLLLARRGLYEEAEANEREVLAAGPPLRLAGAANMYLSAIALLRGDPARALAHSTESLAALEPDTPMRALASAHHANALRASGRIEEAVASARRAMEIAKGGVDEGEAAVGLAWIAALRAAERHDEAREATREAHARLMARASKMDDRTRTSFLALPDNAETLRLASA